MNSEITIKTPFIELDSLLKFANVCASGGEAKLLIQSGKVFLNGKICTMRKKNVYPGDSVCTSNKNIIVKG